jgi:hypothetical protein
MRGACRAQKQLQPPAAAAAGQLAGWMSAQFVDSLTSVALNTEKTSEHMNLTLSLPSSPPISGIQFCWLGCQNGVNCGETIARVLVHI